MSPTRFRCANSLNQGGRVATCRGERAEAPQHRPVTIASGSCSVTVITGDSESLNPGSIPGRACFFFSPVSVVSVFASLLSDQKLKSSGV